MTFTRKKIIGATGLVTLQAVLKAKPDWWRAEFRDYILAENVTPQASTRDTVKNGCRNCHCMYC